MRGAIASLLNLEPDAHWPGHAPWAKAVRDSRREFIGVARSFWLIPEIIPPVARDDVSLLYCVCRHLDDAVDEAAEPDEARANLARWRQELRGEAPARPLIAAFLAGVPRNGLPLACVDHLLDGMESDLGEVRLADDAALLRYAYRVSSAVGLMLAPLLGVQGGSAGHRVVDLGIALQLSNILLGVAGDARRGRVYLPATRLAAAGLTAADVLRSPEEGRLLPVLAGLSALADRHYASAAEGASLVPLRYRHGVLLLGSLYGALGRRAARGDPVQQGPKQLSFATKALHLAELARSALHPRTVGLAIATPHQPALHLGLPAWPGVDHPPLEQSPP